VVRNDSYGSGCASSLLAGLDAAGDVMAVMLLLGDMPGVEPAVIDQVASRWDEMRPWAAVTSYRGVLGHPLVFSKEAFPELREPHGDKAVWKLIERRPERVERIDVDRELPRDVDTWDDYEAALSEVRAAG
jgi:molybdenum cofactor cytidylyltransferase